MATVGNEFDGEVVAATSSWPTVLGVLALLYGIAGLLMNTCAVGASFARDWLLSFQGIEIETPMVIVVLDAGLSVVNLILGIVLITGAVGLLRRRRASIGRLKQWALLRLVMLLIGAIATVATLSNRVDFQMAQLDAQAVRLREANRADLIPEADRDGATRQVLMFSGIFTGVVAVFPLVVGFTVDRRRVREEVAAWS